MFTLRSPAQRQGVTPPPCVSPSPRKFHLPPLHFSSSPLFLEPRHLPSGPLLLHRHPVERW